MRKTFIDTAVIVRTFDDAPRQKRAREAAEQLLEAGDRELVTNALVMAQTYVAIVRAGGRARAREAVELVKPLAGLPIDRRHVEYALDLMSRRSFQLWDAINWSAAILSKCDDYASFDAPGNPHVVDGVRWLDPMTLLEDEA